MKILNGKRTTLVPIGEEDIDYFHFLLKHEGMMLGETFFKDFDSFFAYAAQLILSGRWLVWTAWTKDGKGARKFGFVLVTDISPNSVNIAGLSDKSVMKGLLKLLKRPEKYTYAEDALRTCLDYLFDELNIHRVSANCLTKNIAVKKLLEKCGFEKEGKFKDAVKVDGGFYDMLFFAKLNSNTKEIQNVDIRRREERSITSDERGASSLHATVV